MWTEEELEKMDRYELKHILIQKGLTDFIPKNASKSILVDTILESQEEISGS